MRNPAVLLLVVVGLLILLGPSLLQYLLAGAEVLVETAMFVLVFLAVVHVALGMARGR